MDQHRIYAIASDEEDLIELSSDSEADIMDCSEFDDQTPQGSDAEDYSEEEEGMDEFYLQFSDAASDSTERPPYALEDSNHHDNETVQQRNDAQDGRDIWAEMLANERTRVITSELSYLSQYGPFLEDTEVDTAMQIAIEQSVLENLDLLAESSAEAPPPTYQATGESGSTATLVTSPFTYRFTGRTLPPTAENCRPLAFRRSSPSRPREAAPSMQPSDTTGLNLAPATHTSEAAAPTQPASSTPSTSAGPASRPAPALSELLTPSNPFAPSSTDTTQQGISNDQSQNQDPPPAYSERSDDSWDMVSAGRRSSADSGSLVSGCTSPPPYSSSSEAEEGDDEFLLL